MIRAPRHSGKPPAWSRAQRTAVHWSATGDPHTPWWSKVDSQTWTLRVNDFPERELYTLFVDGQKTANFDDWPLAWQKMERRCPVPAKTG